MWAKIVAVVACLLLALCAGLFVFAARHPAIAPIARPAAGSFDTALVKRGAVLAAIGDCATCHTAPGGAAFAGGVGVVTPFGTIFSTNISPDAETGIGGWSEAAFERAMRQGVRRDGALLYPAFPYDHFTLVSDDDNRALYAFLMTRPAVRNVAPANDLRFPFNHRAVVAGWNLLFLRTRPRSEPRSDTATSGDPSVARGRYLVEGLGHCAACHTPRNVLGAEKSGAGFGGAAIDGWTAYALNTRSTAVVPWTADALYQYLRNGFEAQHGTARGPMLDVIANLRAAPDDDVRAIADYVAAQIGKPTRRSEQIQLTERAGQPPARQEADLQAQRGSLIAATSADSQAYRGAPGAALDGAADEGAAIYAAACADCHQGPRAMPYGGIDLGLSGAITGPTADNLVHIVLHGIPADGATRGPIMPGFGDVLDDNQVGALVRYLRAAFTGKQTWTGIDNAIHAARSAQHTAAVGSPERQAGQ